MANQLSEYIAQQMRVGWRSGAPRFDFSEPAGTMPKIAIPFAMPTN